VQQSNCYVVDQRLRQICGFGIRKRFYFFAISLRRENVYNAPSQRSKTATVTETPP
jgi:hypothetical protein